MTADAVGGVWTYALDLAGELSASRVDMVLALSGPPPSPAQRRDAERVAGLRLVETGSPLDWMADTPDDVLAAGRTIARLAAEIGADLVHLNSPALAAGDAFRQPVVGACHSCVATWWSSVRGGTLPADFAWRSELTRRGYEACRTLIAPSAAFAADTKAAYALRTAPVVIHNGRAAPTLSPRGRGRVGASRPGEGESAFRRGRTPSPYPLPAGERVPASSSGKAVAAVLTAGRLWDEGKNLATLDRAAARLHVPVLAAGSLCGPNGTGIAVRHVEALGPLPAADLDRRMAERPVFVSLALYEPFGLAVLEAAQHGCALVLSDIPAFRELWDGAALFVPARDDGAAAAAIELLLADDALRNRQGDAARNHAARFSVERMAAATLAVYASALAGGRRTAMPVGAGRAPLAAAR